MSDTISPGSRSRGCVLIVEDEADAREMMCEIVEMGGCAAIEAANGAEALHALESSHPCLIVLDLRMPVMDGAEFLEAVQRKPDLAKIPVLIATSAPYRAPAGFPVLAKPIDMTVLWDWMRRTCKCSEDVRSS